MMQVRSTADGNRGETARAPGPSTSATRLVLLRFCAILCATDAYNAESQPQAAGDRAATNAQNARRSTAPRSLQQEADQLYALLDADELPKKTLLSGFREYSPASKNEIVDRLSRTYEPPPKGALLARLPYLRTPENEATLRNVFLANLRSPSAQARKFSLLGLKELNYPSLEDLALLSMRDEADPVLAVAIDILLPLAKKDDRMAAFFGEFYASHKSNAQFQMSVGLLEAHGLVVPTPTKK